MEGVLERSQETAGWHPGWVKSEFSRILVITQSLSVRTFGTSHSLPSALTHPSLRSLTAAPWGNWLAPFASDKSPLEIRRPLSGAQVHPPQSLLQYLVCLLITSADVTSGKCRGEDVHLLMKIRHHHMEPVTQDSTCPLLAVL